MRTLGRGYILNTHLSLSLPPSLFLPFCLLSSLSLAYKYCIVENFHMVQTFMFFIGLIGLLHCDVIGALNGETAQNMHV